MQKMGFSEIIFWCLTGFTIIYMIITAILHSNEFLQQTHIKTQVSIEVEFCNGKKDTIFTTIVGTSDHISINNRNKRLSVPELCSYGNIVIALNVCSFNILNKNQIE